MKRREFITLLGSGAVALPIAAGGQQTLVPKIGVLNGASQAEYGGFISAFREALGQMGYIDGQNVVFEYSWEAIRSIAGNGGRYDQS